MNKTGIEWTDYSSNPIYAVSRETGVRGHHCVKVSPGCAHRYAERLNVGRFGNGLPYVTGNTEKVEFRINEREIEAWRRRKLPFYDERGKCIVGRRMATALVRDAHGTEYIVLRRRLRLNEKSVQP